MSQEPATTPSPMRFSLKVLFFAMTLIAAVIVAYLNGYHDGKFDAYVDLVGKGPPGP
jgi:hypothetical protein